MSAVVEIKACFNKVLASEGVFRIDVDIIDVVNIDFDVLVFDAETDEFSHVASVYDMETYPVTPSLECKFYRGRGAKVPYNNLRDATAFETVTSQRLKVLAVAWNTVICDFEGKETLTVDSNVD